MIPSERFYASNSRPSFKFVRSATYLLNTEKGGEQKSVAVEEDDVSRAALSQSQITSSKGPICPQSMLAINHRPIANEASHIEGGRGGGRRVRWIGSPVSREILDIFFFTLVCCCAADLHINED